MQEDTIRLYKMAFQYLKPIYNLELEKITPLHLQRCIDDMIRNGLAYGTIKTYKNRITAIFNSAVEKDKIILFRHQLTNLKLKYAKNLARSSTKNELDYSNQ